MNKIISIVVLVIMANMGMAQKGYEEGPSCQGDSCVLVMHDDKAPLKRLVHVRYYDDKNKVLVPYDKKNFGYIDSKGNLIPMQYQSAEPL